MPRRCAPGHFCFPVGEQEKIGPASYRIRLPEPRLSPVPVTGIVNAWSGHLLPKRIKIAMLPPKPVQKLVTHLQPETMNFSASGVRLTLFPWGQAEDALY